MTKIFFTRFLLRIGAFAAALIVISLFAIAIFGPRLTQAAEARLFRWESVEIVCSGQQAGTSIPFAGSYSIPSMNSQQRRSCTLRIVWRLNGRVPDWRAEALYQRTVRGNGFLIINGRRTTHPVSRFRGDRRLFQAQVPARSLPTLPTQMGIEILEENGTQVTASPTYRRFVAGDPLRAEAPRILAVQINGGERRVTEPRLRLDLTTAGGQVTHYMVTENVSGRSADFSRSRWQTFPPTTGAARPATYTLRNTSAGQKTIAIKVKSGTLESAPKFASFDFLQLATYELRGGNVVDDVLRFSQQQGFRHSAEPLTRFTECEVGINEGIVFLRPSSGGLSPKMLRVCSYTLFAGRRLQRDWSLKEIKIKPHRGFRLARMKRRGGGLTPYTEFVLDDGGVKPKSRGFVLGGAAIELTLQGPAGADWKDAFRR